MRYIFLLVVQALFCVCATAQTALQQYIDTAWKNSPLINDYNNQVKASAYDLERLKAIFKGPQLDLNGNVLFAPIISTDNSRTKADLNSHGASNYYGFELGQTNGGLYQGFVTYTQPLFGNAKYKVAAAQVEVGRQVSQQAARLGRHDLEKLVIDQYILCLLDEKQIAFTDSLITLLKQQLVLVKKLAEASLLKQSDVSLLNIEYENDQYILATFKASYYSKLMDLNALCGIRDTTNKVLPDVNLQLKTPGVSATGPAPLSGFLEKFRLDSLNLAATQSAFELKYKPTFNFFTNAGLDATYISNAYNRFGFDAGLSFTFNLFDGHQRRLTRERTNILQQTTSFYRDNFNLQNEVRKHKFLADLAAYNERRDNLQKQAAEYTQLLAGYKKEIIQGQISIISYVTVLKSMVMLKRDYFLAETNSLLLVNGYNYWNW